LSWPLTADALRVMSVASYIEARTVLAERPDRIGCEAIDDLNTFLPKAGIYLTSTDAVFARLALRARLSDGRGIGMAAC
jgi:uncharacterized protein with PIN domain